MEKKLKDWKSKTLSQAGKLVLIKSVAQVIPTYLMSCFRIPDGVINKIRAAIIRFWWGQQGEEKRTNWIKWEALCKPKNEGGICLRDLAVFNKALLAKQGWRLLHNGNSLLARTLKARYFPNGSFCTATLGYRPSSTWQGLIEGWEVLNLGLCWVVGNGETIRVWKDNWVMGEDSNKITSDRGHDCSIFE